MTPRHALVAGVIIVSAAFQSSTARTYTVRPDGTGDFPDIQSAITGSADGDIIQLTDGVFTGSGNRNISYYGKAVTVRSIGGDPRLCIIDAQSAGRGINFFSAEGPGSVLQGITVQNGYSGTHGAGIWCDDNSSPTISNCILAFNHSVWTGAGLYCFLESSPHVDHCVFYRNRADISGGGAQFDLRSSAVLTNCTFYGNSAPEASGVSGDDFGSGIVTLDHCIVSFGLEGEAIFCGNGVTLACCDVYGNEGGDYVDRLIDQYGVNGNIREHPLFCDAENGDLTLQEDSPCAPFWAECDRIGALPVACPTRDYACCTGIVCQMTDLDECTGLAGSWMPGMETCDPNPCTPAACCTIEECQLLFEEECEAIGGLWLGFGSTCDPNPCGMPHYVVRPDGSGDFPTIQAAVDGAPDRSIVELADGTFMGDGNRDVSFRGKAIVLRSQNGNPETCVIDCQASSSNPHAAFTFTSNETRTATVQGMTIRNAVNSVGQGVAVVIGAASPQILSNTFEDNGVSCVSADCNALIGENTFRNFRLMSSESAIRVTGTVTIRGNTFRDFISNGNGRAVEIWGTGYAINTGHIEDNRFENINGSAVYLSGSGSAVITGDLRGNLIVACGSPLWAAISIGGTGSATIRGDLSGNTILNGGYEAIEIAGVSTSQSQLNGDFQNNTIVGNAIGIVRGGRIAHLEIRNTILWDNGDDLVNAVSAEVHCSDIGDGDFNGVNGNISLDPLFCDPLAGDYHLDDGSPCRPFSPENPDCDLVGAWPVGCEPSGMEDPAGEAHASALRLLTCAPSPTRGITLLRFSIPTAANVRLAIYGVDGRELAVPWSGCIPAGAHGMPWDGCDEAGRVLSSGTYFVRLECDGASRTGRVHLIR